jgi:hypothetical protein
VGYAVFAVALLGAVPFGRHYPRPAWVVGAFAVGFYGVIGSGQTVFHRYVLPLVPVICLVAAVGAVAAAEWLAGKAHLSRRHALIFVLCLTVLPAAVQCAWFDTVLARKDTRVIAAEWLMSRLKPGDSLHDAGGNYTRLNLSAARDAHVWQFDPATGRFGDESGRIPDWLVLYDSPLAAYTQIPAAVRQLAAEKYELVFQARAAGTGARSATYDHQDAFFMPLSGFSTVERPGPNVKIYRRR